MIEDEMVGWHQRLDGCESEQASGDGDGRGSLVCCSPRGRKRNDLDTKQHLLFQSKQFVFYTHPLLPPSPPTFNLSQHQGLFK